jgi:hypothetical protein
MAVAGVHIGFGGGGRFDGGDVATMRGGMQRAKTRDLLRAGWNLGGGGCWVGHGDGQQGGAAEGEQALAQPGG